ncbi:helix-turn-helix domain-containing protein [Nonomuraea rubra]|uniref:Nitroimidazol reductase NimA-like FMN-containing flavoprotein (Pyridoxamine 5'-phosphate oxidase superfamily)/DNA-binding XRE family transcriptional regulator n=1 Tax=Nonomuraea rubra TaxID=46180 RepID=A0A7X0TWQ5_9ACTN|nr:pyridoxamine 5'-phosphate oxidase family protein [Nonomuraea rubra]MBB6546767.1 nitroimidazol reductase NimA-like FMN-containing flavoprotein (pyridoxamine 5'-phosphate oxidase superfamily)/DNA-binding XRE family transcriptional regulator [Nonomuraea rubra]
MSQQVTTIERLGRRIAQRRDELGLTREDLAARTGIDAGYVAYLEDGPSIREAITRLAAALDTTVEGLLGEVTETPSGAGPASPHPTLVTLSESDCLRLLEPGGVGRIAFEGRFGPTVLPVNFRLSDGAIVFRTEPGGTTDQDLRTGMRDVEYKVAFEVDRIEELTRGGWSVLAQGSLHHVTEEDERAAAAATGVEPWAGGERQQYLKIIPTRLTGRRIQPG